MFVRQPKMSCKHFPNTGKAQSMSYKQMYHTETLGDERFGMKDCVSRMYLTPLLRDELFVLEAVSLSGKNGFKNLLFLSALSSVTYSLTLIQWPFPLFFLFAEFLDSPEQVKISSVYSNGQFLFKLQSFRAITQPR